MANFKRKGPKSTRAGCLMCKPHKEQACKHSEKAKKKRWWQKEAQAQLND